MTDPTGNVDPGQALRDGPLQPRELGGHAGPEDRLPLGRRHRHGVLQVRRRPGGRSLRRHALRRQGDPGPSPATTPATVGFDIEWIELAHGDERPDQGWIREYDGISPTTTRPRATATSPTRRSRPGPTARPRTTASPSSRAARPRPPRAPRPSSARWKASRSTTTPPRTLGAAPVYMSMSEVNKTMADGEGDIQLAENPCGAVYADGARRELQRQPDGARRRRRALRRGPRANAVLGRRRSPTPTTCMVLNDGRVIVGEDTGDHENNMLWICTRRRARSQPRDRRGSGHRAPAPVRHSQRQGRGHAHDRQPRFLRPRLGAPRRPEPLTWR